MTTEQRRNPADERPPMSILHAVATIPVRAELAEQAAVGLAELAEKTRAEDGCLSYDLYRSAAQPGTFVTIEQWRSAEDLDAHMGTPHVQQAIAEFGAMLTGEIAVHPLTPVSAAE